MDYLIISMHEERLLAARFDVTSRGTTLRGATEITLGAELDLAGAAARISEGVAPGLRVVLCVPQYLCAQRALDLPLSDLRKVREILPAHLQGEIVLPVEEAVFDAVPGADGTIMAVWARRADIAACIEPFRQAGCEPQVVTSAPLAWTHLPGVPPDCAVSDGSAVAFLKNGRFAFLRPFEQGDSRKQLRATLSAMGMSGIGVPDHLIIFGEQAEELSAVKGLLTEVVLLTLPEELVPQFRSERNFQQLAGLHAVALACHAGELPDFRRGDLAWTVGDQRLRRQLRLTALLAAVVVVLLFAAKGLQYRAVSNDLASLNKSISTQYRDIFPGRGKAVDELAEVRGELKKLTGGEGAAMTLDALKKLAEAKGSTINGLYEIELEGRSLRIKGDARSSQGVNEFKAALGGMISAAELGEIKSRPDGTVTFTLTGQIREGAR